MEVAETSSNSNINGIGGVAKGRVVAIILENQKGDKSIMIHATVVDEISTLQNKNKQRFNELTRLSAEALKDRKGFSGITEDNFQQVPGGKIQMLIGQNAGQDFFPKEIATFTCGLKVSIHQTKVHDKKRYLGFSG